MWLGAAFTALHVLGLVGGFAYVAYQASQGALTAGDVALYLNAVIQFEAVMFFLPMGFGALFQLQLHAGHLFSFTDNAGAGIQVTPPMRAVEAPASFERGIALRGVGFTYPEGESPVLERIDLTLPAGQVTALVGQNGAGKSTLVKLLTRMYDPDTGQILLDGRPLNAYDLDSLRSRIGVVYQDYARFALTFADNIATGDVTATDPDLHRAAALAGADDIAAELPNRWDTMLTRRFDGGVDLSGGQWQKIATARGFLRDAAFIILDEPTAALDADAERALFDRFRQIMAGRTALLISHRFSTVRMADHIAVLEDGHITETGTHNELVNARTRYAQLFEMQAGRYR
jgi:ATP-binding cassette, subfamily B, bacterial